MTLAIGIAHAAWDPRRHASLRRLLDRLPPGVHVQRSERPEGSWGYARRLWRWAEAQGVDSVCLLNDDVEVCDDFAEAVDVMVASVPDGEILGLHAQGEQARSLAERGVNWCRAYNLTGPGNVASSYTYGKLADWWDSTPDLQCVKNVNEDNVASQWMWDQQRPAWLPLPSPLKHDASVPSTIGYDAHEHRTTLCPWDRFPVDMTDPATWALRGPAHLVPWIENPWFPAKTLDSLRRRRKFEPLLGTCWYCGTGDGHATSNVTNCRICVQCAHKILGAYLPAPESARTVAT